VETRTSGSASGTGETDLAKARHRAPARLNWDRDRGRTDLANLALVCANCHHHLHHEGWRITRTPDGRYTTGPPPPTAAARAPAAAGGRRHAA